MIVLRTNLRFRKNLCSGLTFSLVGTALLLPACAPLRADAPKIPAPPVPAQTSPVKADPNLRPVANSLRLIPFVGLSVLPEKAAGVANDAAASAEGQWDAGSVSALDTDHLGHTFTLRNDAASAIIIGRLQTSCGCTSAAAATDKGPATLPLTLAPGQTVTVVVSVDLAKVAPGHILKSVSVYKPDGLRPLAQMQINGTLRPSLSLSAPLLDFGTVPGGQGRALSVTATWDERLVPGGLLPPLMSTNPDVTVTPQPEVVAAAPKTPGPSAFLHRGLRTRTYQVALSQSAPLGPLSGVLSFQPLASALPTAPKGSSVSQALRAAILAQPTVLLLGQVQGELTAQPQTLLFGRVLSGQSAIREIVLTGTRLEALKTLSVSTASPWISAHLNPSTPVFRDGQLQTDSQVVEVSLRPDAPPGLLSSTLKVTLANGQHLRVPVTADIGR